MWTASLTGGSAVNPPGGRVEAAGPRIPAAEVETLIDEARRRSRAVVVGELTEEFVRRYREALRRHLDPRERHPDGEEHPDGPTWGGGQQAEGWYVYCVVRLRHAPSLIAEDRLVGLDDRPATLVEAGELAAVGALVELAGFERTQGEPDLDEDGWLVRALRSHERVIGEVFLHATVLPFRFGALFPDRDAIRRALHRDQRSMCAELDRLDGAAEWAVRTYLDAPPDEPDPAAAGTGERVSGTEWLRRRGTVLQARTADRARTEQMVSTVHETLSQHASDVVVRSGSRNSGSNGSYGTPMFAASYLVPRGNSSAFRAELSGLARHHPGAPRLDISGPRPPYHFVRLPAGQHDG